MSKGCAGLGVSKPYSHHMRAGPAESLRGPALPRPLLAKAGFGPEEKKIIFIFVFTPPLGTNCKSDVNPLLSELETSDAVQYATCNMAVHGNSLSSNLIKVMVGNHYYRREDNLMVLVNLIFNSSI